METIPDINVFVGNITNIDFAVYDLWLQQIGAERARDHLLKTYQNDCNYTEEEVNFMLHSYVLDQFRIYGMLEAMLHNPTILTNQMTYQISPEAQCMLITKYYEFDEIVVRELLGKKLSKSTRRDLDEISSKTEKTLRCCQRQFDNFRRIFKSMEDTPGRLVENIQKQFLLSPALAWNYFSIVFLANQRFECCKRKVSWITLKDFVECSKLLIDAWTSSTADVDVELDQDFLHELRGVKILISDQKLLDKHKFLTMQKIKPLLQGTDDSNNSMVDVEWCDSSFRHVSRGIVVIASGLYKTKNMRDYFIDIVEKVIEPCKAYGWDKTKFEMFLESYSEAAGEIPQFQQVVVSWKRYISTTTKCILQMCHV